MKKLLIWTSIILGLGFAVWGMAKLATVPADQTQLAAQAITDTDWVNGNRDSQVILIEYSDLQCPACAAYAPIVNRILEELGDRIAFVYRHFPLPQHQNAEPAGWAAEAAGRQGKFWEMLDLIFAGQKDWEKLSDSQSTFDDYARQLGLDGQKFQTDSNSKAAKDKVENDYLSGVQSRVNSTPTFFLNGVKIQPRSYEEFRNLILQNLEPNP